MPIIMDRAVLGVLGVAAWRNLWRRADPKIVVNVVRNLLRAFAFADARTRFVTQAMYDQHFADVSCPNPIDGLLHARTGAALRARPHDAFILARSLDDLASLPNVVRDRFFQIDVLSRLDSPNGRQ